jgi:hypothetical protein
MSVTRPFLTAGPALAPKLAFSAAERLTVRTNQQVKRF